MALHVIKKINTRLRFFYRKNRFLPQPLRRLLCNGIIQPHFAYVCSAWYPYLNKSLKKKLETQQNKCIRFCLNLNNRDHIGLTEFEKINWLPINDHFEQCISSTTFKFFNNRSSAYMNDVFKPAGHSITNTRTSFLNLFNLCEILITDKKYFFIWHQIFGTVYRFLWKQLRALTPTNTR